MSEMKPTPGEWLAGIYEDGGFDVLVKEQGHDGGDITLCSRMPYTSRAAEMHSNARLIAEAGTVFHNTGLSPMQLVEQRDELLDALQGMVDFYRPGAWGSGENRRDALDAARAALAKCEGVK